MIIDKKSIERAHRLANEINEAGKYSSSVAFDELTEDHYDLTPSARKYLATKRLLSEQDDKLMKIYGSLPEYTAEELLELAGSSPNTEAGIVIADRRYVPYLLSHVTEGRKDVKAYNINPLDGSISDEMTVLKANDRNRNYFGRDRNKSEQKWKVMGWWMIELTLAIAPFRNLHKQYKKQWKSEHQRIRDIFTVMEHAEKDDRPWYADFYLNRIKQLQDGELSMSLRDYWRSSEESAVMCVLDGNKHCVFETEEKSFVETMQDCIQYIENNQYGEPIGDFLMESENAYTQTS